MLKPKHYLPRIADGQISEMMKIYGAICVEGPKWCGKTWASMSHAKSGVFIADPEQNFMNKKMAEMNPSLVLEGEYPRLIDEWQEVPALWDAVRFKVDEKGEKGIYILTGSSTPEMKGRLHGGSGRIGKVRMRTMSLYELGLSDGSVSLMDLFNDELNTAKTRDVSLDDIISYIMKGGWPGAKDLSPEQTQEIMKAYLDNIPDDMVRIDGKTRDVKKVKALLRALGRAESTMTSKVSLQKDIEEYTEDRLNDVSITIQTITDYLDCFNRLFLIEDQPMFENKLRSSVKALKNPKRHYSDPSLAVAAMSASRAMLFNDLNTLGYLFEALCIHDLRVYADYNSATVYHYHDERGNEVDAIIQLSDGRWGMIEIKLGFNQVDEAAANLISLKSKFANEMNSHPEFLCVVCGLSNAAFKRPDGVFVIPITALRH